MMKFVIYFFGINSMQNLVMLNHHLSHYDLEFQYLNPKVGVEIHAGKFPFH
jgi:hypothetical protein